MTEKVYEADAYCRACPATVLACRQKGDEYAIQLDRTVFFPEGGGQAGDCGQLTDESRGVACQIRHTWEEEGIVWHLSDRPLPPGAPIQACVAWDVRFDRMQNHTGEHIFSGLAHTCYGQENVGFHLGDREMTVDLSGTLTDAELAHLEQEANAAIYADLPVEIRYPSAAELATLSYRSKKALEGAVRIVTIPGYDCCACCAPHVRRTGEVGQLKILAAMHYKGGMRLTLACGARALQDHRMRLRETAAVSRLCAVEQDACAAGVERLLASLAAEKERNGALLRALAEARLAAFTTNGAGHICHFEPLIEDDGTLRRLALSGAQIAHGVCAVFAGDDREGYRFTIASRHCPLRTLATHLREAYGARGGGNDELISGRIPLTRAALEGFFATYRP